MEYVPKPIRTDDVVLPPELRELSERLAENAHDIWASVRMKQGWTYGPTRDDRARTHPCLIPYSALPEAEKEVDRHAVLGALKATLALGFGIVPPRHD